MAKKSKKYQEKIRKLLKKEVYKYFEQYPDAQVNTKRLGNELNITDKKVLRNLELVLDDLVFSEYLKQNATGLFELTEKPENITGEIEFTRSGHAYFLRDEQDDIRINRTNTGRALPGDTVEIKLIRNRNKIEGKVIAVRERARTHFVGRLQMSDKYAFFIPDDKRIGRDFFILKGKTGKAKDGQKVLVKYIDWASNKQSPSGEVEEVLGEPGEIQTEVKSIIAGLGIRTEFPEDCIAQANTVTTVIPEDEIAKRRDYRKILTFTIDPEDAKDFDDALSYRKLENGLHEIGIHIADVAHYVTKGSPLDKEAYLRGNSVYLVDRVIPMLPEHLSNLVCSLRPNEEKCAFSVIVQMDDHGKIHHTDFAKTVIDSDRRFTYEEAQAIIDGGEGDYQEEILLLNSIARKLKAQRLKSGALEVNGEERRFKLDDDLTPIGVKIKVQKEANNLIEEFMLTANKAVAKFISKKNVDVGNLPGIYRVHDRPDMAKVMIFKQFAETFEVPFKANSEAEVAPALSALLNSIKDEPYYRTFQSMAIRTMAKAEYSTANTGHYGLAFDFYTHFTSPIRRYADLIVHRILFQILTDGKHSEAANLKDVAKKTSKMERVAFEAERDSNKYFQALFVKDLVGKTFKGHITGLTQHGIYVEMEDNFCEGMVRVKDIEGDSYYFDEKEYAVIGHRSKEIFRLGDKVEVLLVNVNLEERNIDLTLI